jgi:hypothetical protein
MVAQESKLTELGITHDEVQLTLSAKGLILRS